MIKAPKLSDEDTAKARAAKVAEAKKFLASVEKEETTKKEK